jgi:hypothetical protein
MFSISNVDIRDASQNFQIGATKNFRLTLVTGQYCPLANLYNWPCASRTSRIISEPSSRNAVQDRLQFKRNIFEPSSLLLEFSPLGTEVIFCSPWPDFVGPCTEKVEFVSGSRRGTYFAEFCVMFHT